MGARGELAPHDLRVRAHAGPLRRPGRVALVAGRERGRLVRRPEQRAPEDLARVAVASSALTFGDDWFLVPCRLPAGAIVRADA